MRRDLNGRGRAWSVLVATLAMVVGILPVSAGLTIRNAPVAAAQVTGPWATYRAMVIAAGPLAYWRLQEPAGVATAVDEIGPHSAARTTAAGEGVYGAGGPPALRNGTMRREDGAPDPETFSFEGWFYGPSDAPADGLRSIFGYTDHFGPRLRWTNGEFKAYVDPPNGSTCDIEPDWELTADFDVLDDQWHHIAMTVVAPGAVKVYVDGEMIGEKYYPKGLQYQCSMPIGSGYVAGNGMKDFGVGQSGGISSGWPGRITEVAIYDRELVGGEIQQRVAALAPPPPPEATATCNIVARLVGACDGEEGDPVSTRSGAFFDSFVDVEIGTRGAPLGVARGYLSLQADREGAFGYGWSSNLDTRLEFDAQGPGVTLITPTGTEGYWDSYVRDGWDLTYSGPSWMTSTLTAYDESNAIYTVTHPDGSTMDFDHLGRLQETTDRNGYRLDYLYEAGENPPGKLDKVRDVDSGREIDISWNGERISQVTDPAGRTVTYEYVAGELQAVVGIDGGRWEYGYEPGGTHRLTEMRNPFEEARGGDPVVNVYDAQGRVISQTDPEGGLTTFDYTSVPGATKVTLPGNNTGSRVRVHQYESGRRIRVIDGYGSADEVSHRYGYDFVTGGITEAVLESVSPERTMVRNDYDSAGNLLWTEDSMGRRTTFDGYDEFGQPSTVTSPDGAVTTLVYDTNGNLESSSTVGVDAESTSMSLAYDPAKPGQVSSMTDPRGKVWTFGYDANGYQTSVTDPLGHKAESEFDAVGRLEWSVSPKGNEAGMDPNLYRTTFETDAWGRVESVVDPEGGESSTEYDELGRPRVVTDAELRSTTYTRDGLGRVELVARHDGSTLGTEYWPDGSLKAQIDADGQRTTFLYDAVGRLVSKTDPAGRTTAFGYRPDGSLEWRQDPGGDCSVGLLCVIFDSNAAGQTTQVLFSESDTPDVTNVVYDAAGRRTSVVTTEGTYGFGYDGLGRLTSSTGDAGTTGYEWDPAGNLETITYPGGGSVSRGYDDAGRWTSVTDWNQQTYTFAPDANGTLEAITFPGPNVQVDDFEADRVGRITGVDYERNGTVWASLDWGRTDAGQVNSMAQSGLPGDASHSVAYDGLGRIASAGSTTFDFDDADNLYYRGAFLRQRHDVDNRLCYVVWGADTGDCDAPPAGATVFGYDDFGNRTSKTPSLGGATTYGYDQQNRLTDISVPTFQNGEGDFNVVDPVRVADTHAGSSACPTSPCAPVGPGETVVIPVAGVAGLPAAGVVGAVSAQLRLEAGTGAGAGPAAVAVYSADRATMNAPSGGVSASYEPGEVATTGILSKVGLSGGVKVTNFGAVPVEVTLDVTGWYGTVWSPVAGSFQPSDPARVFDTAGGQPVPGSGSIDVTVLGAGGVPASGVDAVAVVVTATAGTQDGGLVVTSTDVATPPVAVSVTAGAGSTRSALVQVAPGADGKVRLHTTSGVPVDASVDVVGWYVASDPTSGDDTGFVAVDPLLRWWDEVPAGTPTDVGVPAYASPSATRAVAVTVTVADATAAGEVTVWSGDGTAPAEATTVAYDAGQVATNTATVPYPVDGSISVEASGAVTVYVSVSGYWLEGRRDVSFTYDPDGLRQSKTTHAGTTVFGWDHASGLPLLLEEQGPEGRTRYLYGPGGRPIAQQDPDGRILYLHADQLGSIRAVTSALDGAVVTTRTFDAWGTVQATGETTATPFGYAGEYTDVETGLVYLRARYFDPSTGNFLTRDPIETITREPYAYVGGNPLNATDPSGLCWGPFCSPQEYAEGARSLVMGDEGCDIPLLGALRNGMSRVVAPMPGSAMEDPWDKVERWYEGGMDWVGGIEGGMQACVPAYCWTWDERGNAEGRWSPAVGWWIGFSPPDNVHSGTRGCFTFGIGIGGSLCRGEDGGWGIDWGFGLGIGYVRGPE